MALFTAVPISLAVRRSSVMTLDWWDWLPCLPVCVWGGFFCQDFRVRPWEGLPRDCESSRHPPILFFPKVLFLACPHRNVTPSDPPVSLSLSLVGQVKVSVTHFTWTKQKKKKQKNSPEPLACFGHSRPAKNRKVKKKKSRFYPSYLEIVQPHYWLPFSIRRAPAGRAPTQKVPTHHGGSAQDRQTHTLQSTHCSTLSQTPSHLSNDSNPNETLELNLIRHM